MYIIAENHVAEVRHERGRKLWFDVSEISKETTLLKAELRIYQNPALGKWRNERKEFVITVYAITKTDGEQELEMLSYTNSTSDYHGWLELGATDGLAKWIANRKDNKGLYIGAHATTRPEHEVKLDDIGLVNAKGDDEYQPFLVGYFKGQNLVKPSKKLRSKRNVPARRRQKVSENKNQLLEPKISNEDNMCQIRTLYVSFKDLNWQVGKILVFTIKQIYVNLIN